MGLAHSLHGAHTWKDEDVDRAAPGHDETLQVAVLGPLQLVVDGAPVAVPGPKRRALLALLARAEGGVVATEQLLDALWPGGDTVTARASLHSHVSRLRGHLGRAAHRLTTTGGGYRLALAAGDLDAAQARRTLLDARRIAKTDPATACTTLRKARELWRGPVLPDLVDTAPAITAWAIALDELQREVLDCYLSCAIDAGQLDDVVSTARDALASDPLREAAVLLLMRALAATGRRADALRAGYDYRRRLRAETGLDPTASLGELERSIAAGSNPPAPVPGAPSQRLVGRESELAALGRLITTERVVTVVGPGGVGKTSVVFELVRRLDDTNTLMLAPVTDPAAVPYALASALGLRVVQADVLAACAALLAAGPSVLVVDNCEHLRPAATEMISTLVANCPELTVIATSREPLDLGVERQFRLAPLPLPTLDDDRTSERAPSVSVFLDRARRVRTEFTAGPAELRLIAEIVRRLDGIPLAIELAASRLSSIGLPDLHARLDRALDLLDNGRAAADPRHRTLRATVEWSYQLLTDDERRLFRHLSIFPDGFDLTTAERVATELRLGTDPAGTLAHLVNASMIVAELDGHPRYRMLDTLRAFGLDRLAASAEDSAAEQRLLRWAADLARWIGATEITECEGDADAALRTEFANLRAAWVVARRLGRTDDMITLVTALLASAFMRDLTELWEWARELAAGPAGRSHPQQGIVLGMAAGAAWLRGELDVADSLARQGLDVSGADDRARWWCLTALANVAVSRGAYADAIAYSEEGARLATRPTENYGIAALAAAYTGDARLAHDFRVRLRAVAVPLSLQALDAYVAGEIDNLAGDYDTAEQHYLRTITLARAAGATFMAGIATVGLITVRSAAGHHQEALRGYRELLEYWERTGSWLQQWTTLRNLARQLYRLGDYESALFVEVAADHAPDAPAVGDDWRRESPNFDSVLGGDVGRIRAEAARATRGEVLATARRAIEEQLSRSPQSAAR